MAVMLETAVAMVRSLPGNVVYRGQPPCGPVACGLSLEVYKKVHTGFIVFVVVYNPYYPTPLWCCGLWSGPCGLHEVYGLFI